MNRYFSLFFFLLFLTAGFLEAQVGIGILTPDSTAILHLESTDRGFLAPRMTTTERNAIANPAIGLTVYNLTDSTIQYWNGVCWLSVWQQNCTDCHITANLSSVLDTIDRTIADSISVNLQVIQTAGNTPQSVALNIVGFIPLGMTWSITPNPMQVTTGIPQLGAITFKVTPFTPAGTYPVVIQVFCGPSVVNLVYTIEILPCYDLHVTNLTNNYNMTTDFYATYPTVPPGQAVCVVSYVDPGVTVTSPTTGQPAYNTGQLPPGSVLAIVNNGAVIGKGGDGGIAYDPINGISGDGFPGGHAILLQMDATVLNNGYIYGGGGGGGSMAFQIGFPVGPVFLGMMIGSGGGGGAGGGLGGSMTSPAVGFFFYSPGTNGTTGINGVNGNGGILNFPINFPLGPVTITLNPNAVGGDGGPYGYPGVQGIFQLTISAFLVINIPFVGPIQIPILQNVAIPIPVPPPVPGAAGNAIKHNGNNCSIPDNNYNTSGLKGVVGN